MPKAKKTRPTTKSQLHPRNRHRKRYDFDRLIETTPALRDFVKPNKYGNLSIDFFDAAAVKILNQALLHTHYGISHWDIPANYLCPPIPGRADYVHYLADLLAQSNAGEIPQGVSVKGLDVGIGANGIYPILGHQEYGWTFVGSEIDEPAIEAVRKVIIENPSLNDKIEVREQRNPQNIFFGIIAQDEQFDFTLCNPPFYESGHAVNKEHMRKLKNLKRRNSVEPSPNFGGKSNELWCEGGEKKFVGNMIRQSKELSSSCFWYTTLVSRASHLDLYYKLLKNENAVDVKTIAMSQGNKSSQILAWTFLSSEQQKLWAASRWTLRL